MTHDKTNQFINDYQDGENLMSDTPEQALAADLMMLADSLHMDTEYKETLNNEFEQEKNNKMLSFPTTQRRYLRVAVTIIALVGVVALASSQPVRTFAQDLLDIFIPQQEEATRTIEYVEFDDEDIQAVEGDIDDLQELVPFEVKTPAYIPRRFGYAYRFGQYLEPRNVSSQVYIVRDGNFSFEIKQQPLDDVESGLLWSSFEPYTIGAEADIQELDLEVGEEEYLAQYVRGSWVGDDETYTWDDDFGFYTMRWQDEDYVYEILWHERPHDDLTEDMIKIAESMYIMPEEE